MNRSFALLLAVLATALLAACGGLGAGADQDGRYDIKVAPKAISVDVPPSLVEPEGSETGDRCLAAGDQPFRSERWGAFHWIKLSVWQSQKRLSRAAATIVLLDSVIASKGLLPGTAEAPTLVDATPDLVWTQGMVDAYAAMIPASLLGNPLFRSAARLPAAGEAARLPGFSYWAIDEDSGPEGLYDVVVAFEPESDECGLEERQETKSFYWNGGRTRFKLAHELEYLGDPGNPLLLERSFVAFDAASGALAAGRHDRRGSMSLQLEKDPASSANGFFIAFDAELSSRAADFDGEASLRCGGAYAGASFSFSATGYADDSGGTVAETFTLTPAAGDPLVFYLKESFDSKGRLTLVQLSLDGTTYVDLPLFSRMGARDEYGRKEEGARRARERMERSALFRDIRDELARHAGQVPG